MSPDGRPDGPADPAAVASLRIGFQVWGQFVTWPDLMAAGRRIEELGFDSLYSNDHLLPVAGGGPQALEIERGPVWDGWMTLAGWAAITSRVRLGCLVSGVPFRNPALTVRMVAALDHASDGRAVLGLGAGWHAAEHHAFGFEYPSLRGRLDRLDEAVRICRQLLDGEAANLEGTWFRVADARVEPAPLQARLPLLVGGSGERRTLPLVARFADIWNGEGDPVTFARKSALLDDLCADAGRDPASVEHTIGLPPPLVRPQRGAAVAVLAELLARHGLPVAEAHAAADGSPLVGSAEQVADRLLEYARAGAREAIFDWPTPPDSATLEALAGPVRDALRREPGRG
jgi:alkanesulfonate monooxygenase SsuD/methylene tetrahydromethanopterin reductase-like flavin-dependent oxidoreductase (luciferase family)